MIQKSRRYEPKASHYNTTMQLLYWGWQSDKQAYKVAIARLYSLSQLIKQINRKRNQTLAYGEMQRERKKNPEEKTSDHTLKTGAQ